MKLFLDANVVLDMLANRQPWAHEAALLFSVIEVGHASGDAGVAVSGYVSAHTVTTFYYLLARAHGRNEASAAIVRLMRLVDVIPVDKGIIRAALALGLKDFEDAVQAVCALGIEADYFVSRSGRDFQDVGLLLARPAEIVVRLSAL